MSKSPFSRWISLFLLFLCVSLISLSAIGLRLNACAFCCAFRSQDLIVELPAIEQKRREPPDKMMVVEEPGRIGIGETGERMIRVGRSGSWKQFIRNEVQDRPESLVVVVFWVAVVLYYLYGYISISLARYVR